jgi:hypothetical protein
MRVQPASIDQVMQTADGAWTLIPAQAGTVAGDIAALDRGLCVRLSERGRCFVVFHRWHSGCPHNGEGNEGSEYLVLTVDAHLSRLGVWEGLDERVTRRLQEIDPYGRAGYDYVAELEVRRLERERKRRQEFEERMGEPAELVAHELRKAEGARYRGRVFT